MMSCLQTPHWEGFGSSGQSVHSLQPGWEDLAWETGKQPQSSKYLCEELQHFGDSAWPGLLLWDKWMGQSQDVACSEWGRTCRDSPKIARSRQAEADGDWRGAGRDGWCHWLLLLQCIGRDFSSLRAAYCIEWGLTGGIKHFPGVCDCAVEVVTHHPCPVLLWLGGQCGEAQSLLDTKLVWIPSGCDPPTAAVGGSHVLSWVIAQTRLCSPVA